MSKKKEPKKSKVILLAVTGSSPQVITETLYGIYTKNLDWPTELHIITTTLGAEKARKSLIDENQINNLLNDYTLPELKFNNDNIHIIPDANGNDVEDARNEADHEALADYITRKVAHFTVDKGCKIHASIAGGRKTMTFFLGYAMSMFSRPWDQLSHVLISQEYENINDFYYPTPYSKELKDWKGNVIKGLDAREAKVDLINIPYLRQREQLGSLLIEQFSKKDSNLLKYKDIVELNNMIYTPENIRIEFDYPNCCIIACGIKIPLKLIVFAFYAMIVWAVKSKGYEVRRPVDGENSKDILKIFLDQMEMLEFGKVNQKNDKTENSKRLNGLNNIHPTTQKSLLEKDGIDQQFFDDRKTKLKETLEKYLPSALTDKYFLPHTTPKNSEYKIKISINNIIGIKGVEGNLRNKLV